MGKVNGLLWVRERRHRRKQRKDGWRWFNPDWKLPYSIRGKRLMHPLITPARSFDILLQRG